MCVVPLHTNWGGHSYILKTLEVILFFNMLWNNGIFLTYSRCILNIFLKYSQNELLLPYMYVYIFNKLNPIFFCMLFCNKMEVTSLGLHTLYLVLNLHKIFIIEIHSNQNNVYWGLNKGLLELCILPTCQIIVQDESFFKRL
jgi:hypothetical protein